MIAANIGHDYSLHIRHWVTYSNTKANKSQKLEKSTTKMKYMCLASTDLETKFQTKYIVSLQTNRYGAYLMEVERIFVSSPFKPMLWVLIFMKKNHNYPKFLNRQASANSADPDQTAKRSSLIRVYTVCHSICTFWKNFSKE